MSADGFESPQPAYLVVDLLGKVPVVEVTGQTVFCFDKGYRLIRRLYAVDDFFDELTLWF